MAVLRQIWIKRAHRGKMDAADRATLVAGRGISGNADQGGKRQVTLMELDRWHGLMDRTGSDLETSARRANLVVESLDLFDSRGRTETCASAAEATRARASAGMIVRVCMLMLLRMDGRHVRRW